MATLQTARPRRALLASTAAGALFCLWAAPAFAHGDLHGTVPEKGSTLARAPDHLIINFTEPPAEQSVVSVTDGCSDEVIDELEFDGKAAHVFLSKGQPGKWKVSYKVVSAVDGHRTNGSYALKVTGKRECSGTGGAPDGPDKDGSGPGPQAGEDGDPDEEESSFPVVPVALGSLGLVALALVARRLSG